MQKSETQNNRREIAPDIFTLYDNEDLKDLYVVIDRSGTVLASTGKENLNGGIFQTGENLLTIETNLLKTAVSGETAADKLVERIGNLRFCGFINQRRSGKTGESSSARIAGSD